MHTQQNTSPAWFAIIVFLAGALSSAVDQVIHPLVVWWAWGPACLLGLIATALATLLQQEGRNPRGWGKVFTYRSTVWIILGVIQTVVDLRGWSTGTIMIWAGSTIALPAIGHFCPVPPAVERGAVVAASAGYDRRPSYVKLWEANIRAVAGWKTATVSRWERWENPDEGFRLWVELPIETGTTEQDLAQLCTKLAASARLRTGCHVQTLPSDVQGVAVLDVMEVDNLGDTDDWVHVEPTTPASINDSFTVLTTPRGQNLDICLRIETATIGGATGSGKTTLMNRIIMFLARCVDCLIWVADYNGGGLANNWIEPWARGKCGKPVVDWVASDENEFAVMTAVARAISTARKHNPTVRQRIRAARSGGVLPVSADLPAIIVLADEGGSIQQKLTAIGAIAAAGLTELAQLGRAMAVRAMVSVLRGTSDLMDKGLRSQSSTRLCLRMNEHGEYVHVLDVTPPKTPLKHKGAGYLRTMELDQPVYGRTVNVDEHAIEHHAIACSSLRPDLDQHGQAVAARVRPEDVTGGDKDYPGWVGSIQYLHCLDGRAYSGRWGRAAQLLAELRDEDLEEEPQRVPAARPVAASLPATATPALDAWAASVRKPAVAETPAATVTTVAQSADGATVIQFPGRQTPVPAQVGAQPPAPTTGGGTAREQIVRALHNAGPDGLTASELEAQIGVSKQRMYQLLPPLAEEGVVGRTVGGGYVLARDNAVSTG